MSGMNLEMLRKSVDWMILGLFFSGIGGFGCLSVSVDLEIFGVSVDLRLGVFQKIVLFGVSEWTGRFGLFR